MVFTNEVVENTFVGYRHISAYLAELRRFYEILDARLLTGEYGVTLTGVGGDRLFSTIDSYALSPVRNEAASAPFYVWFPAWLGRFYEGCGTNREIDSPGSTDQDAHGINQLAFVWSWIGRDDAYVADVDTPECWLGIVQLPDSEAGSTQQLATRIWRFFRLESTVEGEQDDWLVGTFHKDELGCDLEGRWHLRRIQIANILGYYDLQDLVVRPLVEKYQDLTTAGVIGDRSTSHT